MKNFLILLLASSTILGCNSNSTKTPEQIKANLQKQIPGMPADLIIGKSQVKGMYEVVVGRKVFYVTEDGDYLMFGNLIAVADKKNLTEQRVQELSKIDFNKLPLDLAIKEVNGSGKNKLVVFSDPDCPYCQLFEKQIAPKLKDTTIYTFFFPLPNHPNAKAHSQQILCSKDKTLALTSWMRNNKMISTDTSCDTSVLDKIMKVATDVVQLEVTPTLILENGQILQNMLPAEQLIEAMEQVHSKK